jgi:hypothetical protein
VLRLTLEREAQRGEGTGDDAGGGGRRLKERFDAACARLASLENDLLRHPAFAEASTRCRDKPDEACVQCLYLGRPLVGPLLLLIIGEIIPLLVVIGGSVHVAIDDHSRVARADIFPDQKKESAVTFLFATRPVMRWPTLLKRPSFLMSRWIISPGFSRL